MRIAIAAPGCAASARVVDVQLHRERLPRAAPTGSGSRGSGRPVAAARSVLDVVVSWRPRRERARRRQRAGHDRGRGERRSPTRRAPSSATSHSSRPSTWRPTGSCVKPDAQVERERAVVVLLGVDVRALGRRAPRSQRRPSMSNAWPRPRPWTSGATASRCTYPAVPGAPEEPVPARLAARGRDADVRARGGARRLAQRRARRSARTRRTRRRRPRGARRGRRASPAGCARSAAGGSSRSWASRCSRPRTAKPTSTSGRLAPGPRALVTTSR